jgi:thiamine pyrophosphate-dependent acetolactate synthase large subunit-like protein
MPGQKATDMVSLDRPNLDWLALAKGHSIDAGRANDLQELAREFKRAMAVRGPISSSWSGRESKSRFCARLSLSLS